MVPWRGRATISGPSSDGGPSSCSGPSYFSDRTLELQRLPAAIYSPTVASAPRIGAAPCGGLPAHELKRCLPQERCLGDALGCCDCHGEPDRQPNRSRCHRSGVDPGTRSAGSPASNRASLPNARRRSPPAHRALANLEHSSRQHHRWPAHVALVAELVSERAQNRDHQAPGGGSCTERRPGVPAHSERSSGGTIWAGVTCTCARRSPGSVNKWGACSHRGRRRSDLEDLPAQPQPAEPLRRLWSPLVRARKRG
jgi:hypothetical protein